MVDGVDLVHGNGQAGVVALRVEQQVEAVRGDVTLEVADVALRREPRVRWGVRSLGKRVHVNAEGDLPAEAVADLFPAYDDDGGLLLVLTPR